MKFYGNSGDIYTKYNKKMTPKIFINKFNVLKRFLLVKIFMLYRRYKKSILFILKK